MESKIGPWEIGAWYYNPMMEGHGTIKARYTKLAHVELNKYETSSELYFDEVIFPDGKYSKVDDIRQFHHYTATHQGKKIGMPDTYFITQSNPDYEDQMVKVLETPEILILSMQYGI